MECCGEDNDVLWLSLAEEAGEFPEDVFFCGSMFVGEHAAAESEHLAEWQAVAVAESFEEGLFVIAAVAEVVFRWEVGVVFDGDGGEPDFAAGLVGGCCGCDGSGGGELGEEYGGEEEALHVGGSDL